MKFIIELNLEDKEITEMSITKENEDETYGYGFVELSTDKPIDIHQAIQLIKEELDYYIIQKNFYDDVEDTFLDTQEKIQEEIFREDFNLS